MNEEMLTKASGLINFFADPQKESVKYDTSHVDCIQVCVRVRPILMKDDDKSSGWICRGKTILPCNTLQTSYSFDHLFPPESSNKDLFEAVVKDTVFQSMQGYHGIVFTYGQTSSGKTFTMNGTQSQPGIISQSITFCFDSIQEYFTDREFLLRVSYLEIYNEQVKDLLSTEPTQIKIHHDSKTGTILSGVKEQVVLNSQQVIALLKAGEAHRHVGITDMNEKSSRAHTILKIIVESKKRGEAAEVPVRVSVLNLVDLAGSENAKMTNSTGERAREAKCINQSLLTLSLIIQRLSKEKSGSVHKQYLPYRDSKLTRLLQPSLSGMAKICVICTVSPTLRCVEESLNTLKFAARAKTIKTRATINEMIDDKTLLMAYKNEIHSLKARLAAVENQSLLRLLSESHVARSNDRMTQQNVDEDEEWYEHCYHETDESAEILQMISEMERLILKSDLISESNEISNPVAPITQNDEMVVLGRKSALRSPSSCKNIKKTDNLLKTIRECNPSPGETLQEKLKSTELWTADDAWGNIESPSEHFNLTSTSDEDESTDTVGSIDYPPARHAFLNSSMECVDSMSGRNLSTVNAHMNRREVYTASAARKFGFVPSKKLSQSLIKVANDGCAEINQAHLSVSSERRFNIIEDADFTMTADKNCKRDALIGGGKASFGVSEMLCVLKQYVEKSSSVVKRRPQNVRLSPRPTDMSEVGNKCKSTLDLKLISEDYKLLILELERKDNLLSMLTEGLREVESSQERWLSDNNLLFQELEQVHEVNEELSRRIVVLEAEHLKKFSELSCDLCAYDV